MPGQPSSTQLSSTQLPQQHDVDPADLMLNPAVRLLWRTRSSVQLELGTRAVVVSGVDYDVVRRLVHAPNPSSTAGSTAAARSPFPATAGLRRALADLHAAGYLLIRRDADDPAVQVYRPPPRLAGQLAALGARHGDDGPAVLAHRRTARVVIHGVGRLAAMVGSLLAAAGVGHVHVAEGGDVRLGHLGPGGLEPPDEGRRFNEAVARAIRRAAPEVDTGPAGLEEPRDLAIVAAEPAIDDDLRAGLHARSTPHLVARVGADVGQVGPLVIPGATSCLRCADLHRLDRDAAWAALSLQLTIPRRYPAPSDVALAGFVASLTTLQALAFLDGERPATLEGTLELQLPRWQARRRSWPAHPACDCGAPHEPDGQRAE